MNILITGCCGFIGFHQSKRLLDSNNKFNKIIGIDNINSYYDVNLKKNRLKILKKNKNFKFFKIDLKNINKLESICIENKVKIIIHLAAQAGVRYSIDNPKKYFDSNISGFFNILELSRKIKIKHLIFASTSSVYGNSNKFPLEEKDNTDNPLTFYAATKKSNEVMAYSYSNIYKLPCTALRFFTVYGPYGRPDMSIFKFIKSMKNNNKLQLFNKGNHVRDFTYIDDVTLAITKLVNTPSKKAIPYSCFNVASGRPIKLMKVIEYLEKNLQKKAIFKQLNLQKGDVIKTHSSIKKLKNYIKYTPKFNIEKGLKEIVKWYNDYFQKL